MQFFPKLIFYFQVDLHNPCIEIGQLGTSSADTGNKLVLDCGRLQINCAKGDQLAEKVYNKGIRP